MMKASGRNNSHCMPMLTNIKTATLFCAALAKGETEGPVRSMGEMYAMG